MIALHSNFSEIDRHLDDLESMPTMKAKFLLDSVLDRGFAETQSSVHVVTGALKSSGRKKSDSNKLTHTWEGEITYGGTGVVDYAIYEKNRGVGGAGGTSDARGDHDFMRPLAALDPAYRAAMREAMRP